MPMYTSMASRDRLQAARGVMRPPSAPPTGTKRKERDFDEETGDDTNINVVVRCRGRSEREVRENSGVVVSTTGVKSKSVELCMGPNAISNKTYHFDKVFSPAADQAIIFEDVVQPFLSEMLSGFNCTIFAYGQTGTGKTYTMSGDMTDTLGLLSDNAGIIPRVLYSLFQKLEDGGVECSVKCSFIELYNEELRDLLSADDTVKLKIFDDSGRKSHSATVIQGMEESHIKSATAGIKLLQEGSHRRQVAATKCNDLSSRSHTVFTITTYIKKTNDSKEDYICSGKLNLVDLAGSENIQRSGAENKRAAEAGLINKSLLTLGRVINALVDKSQHIPYRESKLTRLLQDSLGGRTKTCIIATVSPSKSNLEETISTLDYAFRAKNIRNKPQINSMISKKTLLKEFTTEIEKLKSELIATRQRNGVYLSNEQYEEITVESESRRILSEEQKARMETMEASLRNKSQELFNLTHTFSIMKRDNEATKALLENTSDILAKTDLVLKDTERSLAEEAAMRKAHQTTEVKLRGIGSQLISAMDQSVHDMEGLHAKLRRRSALHMLNKETWAASTVHAENISQRVDDQISRLHDRITTQLAVVSDNISTFAIKEIERLGQCKDVVRAGASAIVAQNDAITQQSICARDDLNEVLEEIKSIREEVRSRVGQGLQGLSDAAAKISGEVISELDQFHAQLHTSYSGLGKDFKTMFEDMASQLAAQRAESDRLRLALQEANRKNIESSIRASTQLEHCLDAERNAAHEEKEQLMQQIHALITASHSHRDERLSKAIIDTKSEIMQDAEDFERADKTYGEGMDTWAIRDSSLRTMVDTSKDALKGRMKVDWTAVESRNSAIQDSTKAVHEETVRIVDEQMQAMASQMGALDDFVSRAREQNNGNHLARTTNLGDLTDRITSTFDNLSSLLTTNASETFQVELEGRLEDIQSSIAPLEQDIRAPLQDLTSHFASNNLAEYVATGKTPQRKAWEYPTTLPETILSTTPPTNPPSRRLPVQTPSRLRSPRKSPKKMTSPRKTIKEVYVDSPAAIPVVTAVKYPIELKRAASAKSMHQASLKEVDVNSSNHTINLPIKHDEVLITHQKATIPLKEGGRDPIKHEKFSASTRTPHRSVRPVRSVKNFSASVGVSVRAPTPASGGEDNDGGKENFQPSKSVQVHSMNIGGRRLRSGNVTGSKSV